MCCEEKFSSPIFNKQNVLTLNTNSCIISDYFSHIQWCIMPLARPQLLHGRQGQQQPLAVSLLNMFEELLFQHSGSRHLQSASTTLCGASSPCIHHWNIPKPNQLELMLFCIWAKLYPVLFALERAFKSFFSYLRYTYILKSCPSIRCLVLF